MIEHNTISPAGDLAQIYPLKYAIELRAAALALDYARIDKVTDQLASLGLCRERTACEIESAAVSKLGAAAASRLGAAA